MGVNGRAKGHAAERKLAKLFEKWWGSAFTRTPLSGGFATAKFREDWNACGDLVTPDKSFPFCVENKKVEGWTLEQMLTSQKTHMHKWWEQTVTETPEGKIPLLVFSKNHAPLYAMMRYSDLHVGVKGSIVQTACMFETRVGDDHVVIFALDYLLKSMKEIWLYDR